MGSGLKIALIAGEYPPYIIGGGGFTSHLLVRQLRKKGIVVDVYAFTREHKPLFSKEGITRYYSAPIGNNWPIINIHTIAKLWNKLDKYDLAHVISTQRMAALGFLKKISPIIKTVGTLGGIDGACLNYMKWSKRQCSECKSNDLLQCAFERKEWIENKLIKNLVPPPILFSYFTTQRSFAQRLDKYFAVSQTMRQIHVACGFPESKVEVIAEMIDPQFFEKLQRSYATKRSGNAVILYVGRLSKEKGVADLIRAFSLTRKKNAELRIVGKGPERKELEKIVDSTGMQERVRFFGWVDLDTLLALYKGADIFVHPGIWPEPFGRTILEAMLAKLAIIASRSGAPPDTLGDSGMLYEAGDVTELAENLEILIDDEELRGRLGAKAYRKAVLDYNSDVITDRIINEYERLVTPGKTHPEAYD